MTEELYRKYRPKSFKDVLGQDAALKPLIAMGKKGKIPHSILLTGASGVGKTTIARILAKRLKCSSQDLYEINGAQVGGIDAIRDITSKISFAPMGGESRVWILDECAKITSAGSDGLLKVLEEAPKHVYFFLCTTDPEKLKRTIKTRCHLVELKSLSDEDIGRLVLSVAEKEGKKVSSEVVEKIQECSEGSARQALVFLHAIMELDGVESQLEAISKGSTRAVGIDIARALFNGSSWKVVSKILKQAKDEDAEKVRWIVMGYANSVLLNKGSGKAAHILECFRDNFFDSKHNGLSMACWESLHGET